MNIPPQKAANYDCVCFFLTNHVSRIDQVVNKIYFHIMIALKHEFYQDFKFKLINLFMCYVIQMSSSSYTYSQVKLDVKI